MVLGRRARGADRRPGYHEGVDLQMVNDVLMEMCTGSAAVSVHLLQRRQHLLAGRGQGIGAARNVPGDAGRGAGSKETA
jgi:hypothetical protein